MGERGKDLKAAGGVDFVVDSEALSKADQVRCWKRGAFGRKRGGVGGGERAGHLGGKRGDTSVLIPLTCFEWSVSD